MFSKTIATLGVIAALSGISGTTLASSGEMTQLMENSRAMTVQLQTTSKHLAENNHKIANRAIESGELATLVRAVEFIDDTITRGYVWQIFDYRAMIDKHFDEKDREAAKLAIESSKGLSVDGEYTPEQMAAILLRKALHEDPENRDTYFNILDKVSLMSMDSEIYIRWIQLRTAIETGAWDQFDSAETVMRALDILY